ncbi:hypothetical protein [Acinetobacter sp. MD2]|uniref:hypothetical protein n=1 Tax=Acinetobacter sp. MD2 TaxID=2600066 RepID=UPI002D1E71ED|nr:hypothetical protein [Acinetobacter sp. MD2]MEB3767219.1 hypothetical protein [Acinetobacter sp. MD2]
MRFLYVMGGFAVVLLTGCSTLYSVDQQTRTDAPLQQLLKLQPDLFKGDELYPVSIQQSFNAAEAPTIANVQVLETGLMDDSVSAIRTDYVFKRKEAQWKLDSKQQTYQCVRGNTAGKFQTALCP